MPVDLDRPMLRTVATLAPTAMVQQFIAQRGEANQGQVNASLAVTGTPADLPTDSQIVVEVVVHQHVVLPLTLYFSVGGGASQEDQLLQQLQARGFEGTSHGMVQDALVVSVDAHMTIHKLPGGILEV